MSQTTGEHILINALREIVEEKSGRGIILLASRGSGKTVASYRCEHLLANASTSREIFGGSRPLVFRWAKANWPTTTADNLIDLAAADFKLNEFLKIKSGLPDASQLSRSVIEYAIEEKRMVIIVDAYDELDGKQKDSLRAVHARTLVEGKSILWIITSRDYAVNEAKDTFFREDVFRRLRIQPFSRQLQNQFMERALRPMVKSWRKDCFKNSAEDWDKELGTPLTLRQVAVMINESTSKELPLPSFSSLSDLFVQSSDRMIEREFNEHDENQEKRKIGGRTRTLSLCREYLERALGAIAFELAVRGIWKEVVGTSVQIAEVIAAAKERYSRGCKESELDARINSEISWEWAETRIGEFEINNGVYQADINKEVLSFTTRHVQEMRCARYLSKFTTAPDLRDAEKLDRCALGHNGDLSWTDIWKSIIKMPVNASSDNESGPYLEILKVLFERPTNTTQRRPTSLMWEADQWVKQRHAEMGAKFREHLRGQFLAIVNGPDSKEKKIARDLIDLNNFVVLADHQNMRDEFDTGIFKRGKQEVYLSRYLICKYAVSNEQYWLFDSNFVDVESKRRLGDFNSSSQPAVFVSWYDAYWYCEFLEIGLQELRVVLPTEARWEYAIRSGSTGAYFRNGEGQEVTEQDLENYSHFGQDWYLGKTIPVKGHGKNPNAWGLEMMAGNVWEWCWDCDGEYPEDAVLSDPFGSTKGSYRVDRGGGWNDEAAYCRSALRAAYDPLFRAYDLGFRLALSSSKIPESPESEQ
jgi:hypothetical protein